MRTRFSFLLFFVSFIFFFTIAAQSFSLERDFVYRGKKGDLWTKDGNLWSNEACINLLDQNISLPKHLDLNVVPILKKHQKSAAGCIACHSPLEVFAGYFLFRYKKGYPFLNNQIAYAKKYPNFQAYWPETSECAENINTKAAKLFKDLFTTTAISKACCTMNLQRDFPVDSLNISYENLFPLLPVSLISQCFRFSDYYVVCRDLEAFVKKCKKKYYTDNEYQKIVDKIYDILAILAPLFEDLYLESLSQHFTEEIKMDLQFLQTLFRRQNQMGSNFLAQFQGDLSNYKNDEVINKSKNIIVEHNYSKYEVLLGLGTALNEAYLYSDAIATFTKATELEKDRTEAYIERSYAFFELNQQDNAFKDFKKVNSLKKKQKNAALANDFFTLENQLESLFEYNFYYTEDFTDLDYERLCIKGWFDHYSIGFCVGLQRGAIDGIVDFVPNTLSCCSGILHGLWSYSKNPIEGTKNLIEISYLLAEKLRKNTLKENLELVVPELRYLFQNWDSLNSYDRGDRLGYIFGKYGIDILMPLITIKTVNSFLLLKRANTIATLKACTSKVDAAKVLERSANHAKVRQTLWNSAKTGKIIVQDGNKIPHVLQQKHSWEKLINLTGNQTEDFIKVVSLLENNNILLHAEYIKTTEAGLKIMRCEMTIGSHIVEASFIEYPTKEVFLTNAFVKTR